MRSGWENVCPYLSPILNQLSPFEQNVFGYLENPLVQRNLEFRQMNVRCDEFR
jgi:hypothetical protein